MVEEVAFRLDKSPAQTFGAGAFAKPVWQGIADFVHRSEAPKALHHRVSEHQRALAERTDQHGRIEQCRVFAGSPFTVIQVNQTGAGLVLVVGSFSFVRVVENGAGHGLLIGIPAKACVDIPQSAQAIRQLVPARVIRSGVFAPVIDVLLFVGNEQQWRQLVDQPGDGTDFHRQLDCRADSGLQGQEVFVVEVRHRGAGQAKPHQRVGKGFELIGARGCMLVSDDPCRRRDHGPLRVDLQVRIQRFEGLAQCCRGDFPQRGAGHQLGQHIDRAG